MSVEPSRILDELAVAPTQLRSLTGVTEHLMAKHLDPIMDEGLHAHRWTVTAYCLSEPWRDGRALKAGLRNLLDHLPDKEGVLPSDLWSGEALAAAVQRLLPWCVAVRITRPEGFEAMIGL